MEWAREAAVQADRELPIIKDKKLTSYLNKLGEKLVRYAPGETDYPWKFKFVNEEAINAFALPGGFIYVNRGIVEVAGNESEIAGVVAHEIGHVVMRHSTKPGIQDCYCASALEDSRGISWQRGNGAACSNGSRVWV